VIVEGLRDLMNALSALQGQTMEVWVETGEAHGKPVGRFQKDDVIYEHLKGFRTFNALLGKTLKVIGNPIVPFGY